jgi:hypothetical protein
MAGWASDKGLIRFLGGDGQPVLAFEPKPAEEESLVARASTGETYFLELREKAPEPAPEPAPPGARSARPERLAARLMPPLFARPAPPPPTPVDPDKAPPIATVPGVYAIDRYFSREICRISLGPAELDASGRREARLLEGCHDSGLQVFDPVAWRYESGRLTIEARRGHQVTLISERDGQWRRDPDVGSTLVLRKAEP